MNKQNMIYPNKMSYIHTVEYYLATKRNDTLLQATKCMNLENVTLSERKQSHTSPMI